jgi:adenosylmethionine-8-amino-7-oxononanoate aminotransferase
MATRLTGEEIEELKSLGSAHFWPHGRPTADMSDETGVRLVTDSEGPWVETPDGTRLFDMIAGMWLKNIGHGRKEIAEAVYAQMLDISYSPGGTVSPATIQLAAKVASLSPDKSSRVYFVSGGSEAVETAVKIAKKYQSNIGQTTRYKVLSRRGSYHGSTHACMALGGSPFNRVYDYGPIMPGNVHVAQPNEYRCVFCSDSGKCSLQCANDVERAIEHEGPSTVAAFIGEPISIAAGVHIPHPDYWSTIRDICDKHGVVLIADEVITGFGRTGTMFGTEQWDLKPDIFTVAKALTSGYLPIGAAVASERIADAFGQEEGTMFRHLITFGGNPPACAAGLKNIEIMETEGMVQNSADLGDYLFDQLQTLREHPIVGDIRGGMGLLAAVEFVKDRDTKEHFPASAQMEAKLYEIMSRHGLLGRGMGGILFFAPPLSITKDDVDWLVRTTDKVVGELEAAL